MEWIPKFLDNIDSTAHAVYQSLAGYHCWVVLRLMLTIVAVSAIAMSPVIRMTAIAIVVTFVSVEAIDRLVSHRRRLRVARVKG